MTREEAIKIIDCYDIGFYDLSGEKIPADKLADAFDMAIEALSAEAEMKCIAQINVNVGEIIERIKKEHDIERPKGEWIKKQVFNLELDKYVPFVECSVCGYEPYYGGSESQLNYCANCGADMRGKKEWL